MEVEQKMKIQFNFSSKIIIFLAIVILIALSFHILDTKNTSSNEVIFNNLEGNGTNQNPYQIFNTQQLNSIRYSKNSSYILKKDIDAERTKYWNKGRGFNPIGNYESDDEFKGIIYGRNNTISNLHIKRPLKSHTGLISYSSGSIIQNLNIKSASVTGSHHTGMLIGSTGHNVSIQNVNISGSVKGQNRTGGLVGSLGIESKIQRSISKSNVSGNRFVGGLVGYNQFSSTITQSVSLSAVNGTNIATGGLVGRNEGSIVRSHADSLVSGNDRVGGLAGDNLGYPKQKTNPKIIESNSNSKVSGKRNVGLFVGYNGLTSKYQPENKNYTVIIDNSSYVSKKDFEGIAQNNGEIVDLEVKQRP